MVFIGFARTTTKYIEINTRVFNFYFCRILFSIHIKCFLLFKIMRVAHALARYAKEIDDLCTWEVNLPDEFSSLLSKDFSS